MRVKLCALQVAVRPALLESLSSPEVQHCKGGSQQGAHAQACQQVVRSLQPLLDLLQPALQQKAALVFMCQGCLCAQMLQPCCDGSSSSKPAAGVMHHSKRADLLQSLMELGPMLVGRPSDFNIQQMQAVRHARAESSWCAGAQR